MPIFLLTESLHDRFNEQKPIKRGGDQKAAQGPAPPQPPVPPAALPTPPPPPRRPRRPPGPSGSRPRSPSFSSTGNPGDDRQRPRGCRAETPAGRPAPQHTQGCWGQAWTLARARPFPILRSRGPNTAQGQGQERPTSTTVHRRCCSRQWGSPGLAAASHATGTRPCLWSSWSLRQEPGVSSSA